jgi:hypothetical protein
MFNSISWQEFLTTLAIALGVYYVITSLLPYGSEITNFFKQTKSNKTDHGDREGQSDPNETNDLVGKIRYEVDEIVPREKNISAEDIQVHSSNENEEAISSSATDHSDTLIIGTIANLLQEIKVLTDVVKDSSKEEAVTLFKTLLSSHSKLATTHFKEAADKGYSQRSQGEWLRKYCDINKVTIRNIIFEDHSARTFNRLLVFLTRSTY